MPAKEKNPVFKAKRIAGRIKQEFKKKPNKAEKYPLESAF